MGLTRSGRLAAASMAWFGVASASAADPPTLPPLPPLPRAPAPANPPGGAGTRPRVVELKPRPEPELPAVVEPPAAPSPIPLPAAAAPRPVEPQTAAAAPPAAPKPAAPPASDAKPTAAGEKSAPNQATPAPEDSKAAAPASTAGKPAPSASDDSSKSDDAAKPPTADDPVAARADATARLGTLPKPGDKEATAATKSLREVLEARVKLLDEWDSVTKERQAAEHPEPSPESQLSEVKARLARAQAALAQTAKEPDALLPAVFRNVAPDVRELPDAVRNEMKEAIDAAQTELKDWSGKLEQLRAGPSKKEGGSLSAIRSRRDKTHKRVVGLKGALAERESTVAEAKTSESRALARERLVNHLWETRVEAERLKALDAQIVLEGKREEIPGLELQVIDGQTQLAQRALDRMKARYRALAARQERDLHNAAVQEKSKAKQSDDPLERYRAKRNAELLELEARVLATENLLATSPSPSPEEQRALADKAESDFTSVKHLLDDGKVSHLDALRLTNDFRRIGAERARIVRNELAVASNRLTSSENALSGVELELVYDSRDDRFELDTLLERVERTSHRQANALFDELERRHSRLLERRRAALEKLARRAEETHEQVQRRLRVLDEHFGFIRTHLFWVRDEEPVGAATAAEAQRELRQVGRAAARLTEELCDRASWGRLSPEFLTAAAGLVLLPWPLVRLHAGLRPRTRRTPPTPA